MEYPKWLKLLINDYNNDQHYSKKNRRLIDYISIRWMSEISVPSFFCFVNSRLT